MGKEYIRPHVVQGLTQLGGVVFFYDPFDSKAQRWTSILDTAGRVVVTTDQAYTGSASLGIISTGVPAVTNRELVGILVPVPVAGRFHVSLFWKARQLTGTYPFIIFRADILRSTGSYIFQLRFNPVAGNWQYWSSAGAWVTIAGSTEEVVDDTWHRFALIVNTTLNEYVSFESGSLLVSLAGISGQSEPASLGNSLDLRFGFEYRGIIAQQFYIDEVVVVEA